MPVPERLRLEYEKNRPLLRELRDYVSQTLRPYCESQGYMFLDRIKDVESLSEKLEGGRYGSWDELDDLYACTVVIPVPEHEQEVLDKLARNFEPVRTRDRSQVKKAPDVFRFDGLRWYGKMRSQEADRRQPGLEKLTFEVQVLTAFEHALSLVTHDLVYKADNADWRRLRLAAQLKAAVEQLELIIVAFDQAADSVRSSPWPDTDVKSHLIDSFKALVAQGLIPEPLVPGSWRRFADNVVQLIQSFDRNPQNLATRVDALLQAARADLSTPGSPAPPLSGSLFRYVLSLVQQPSVGGRLDRFVIVESSDLTELYGMERVEKRFRFSEDGI
jgi:ppGpp synthetase/RelA/SpoT-type nucleotidyltranferase